MAELKKEIAGSSPELKHVDETADRSAPKVEHVVVQKNPMLDLNKEIADKKGEIESFAATGGVKVVKEGVLGEITKGPSGLKHVDEAADRSAPIIEGGVQVKMNPMAELKKEIAGSSPELKSVEASDRSAPVIDKDVTLKPALMPVLADELKRRVSGDGIASSAIAVS